MFGTAEERGSGRVPCNCWEEEGPTPILSVPGTQATSAGLESSDAVDLEVWKIRPVLIQCPQFPQRRVKGRVATSVGHHKCWRERGDESLNHSCAKKWNRHGGCGGGPSCHAQALASSVVEKWGGVGVDGDLPAAHEVDAEQVQAGLA